MASMRDEEDDDLELLRRAALNSRRKPSGPAGPAIPSGEATAKHKSYNYSPSNRNRGGFDKWFLKGRHTKNVRNTNLISIPVQDTDGEQPIIFDPIKPIGKTDSVSKKLILPQIVHCNNTFSNTGSTSKFRRYDNSDEESESESEIERTDDEDDEDNNEDDANDKTSDRKPEAVTQVDDNSLEAIMQDLEQHLNDKPVVSKSTTGCDDKRNATRLKKKKDRNRKRSITEKTEKENSPRAEQVTDNEDRLAAVIASTTSADVLPSSTKVDTAGREDTTPENAQGNSPSVVYSRSPPAANVFRQNSELSPPQHHRHMSRYPRSSSPCRLPRKYSVPLLPVPPGAAAINHNHQQQHRPPSYQQTSGNLYEQHHPLPLLIQDVCPPVVPLMITGGAAATMLRGEPMHRALSPLNFQAPCLSNMDIAMAPLSPRSAAFVLDNRAALQRRKAKRSRSRSRSRSLSPRSPVSMRQMPHGGRGSLSPTSTADRHNHHQSRSSQQSLLMTSSRPRRTRSISPTGTFGAGGMRQRRSSPPLRKRRSPPPLASASQPLPLSGRNRSPPTSVSSTVSLDAVARRRDRRGSPPHSSSRQQQNGQKSVKNRLGNRRLSMSPVTVDTRDRKTEEILVRHLNESSDQSVLEARKRKFERIEITVPSDNKIIKLKKEDTCGNTSDPQDNKLQDSGSDDIDDELKLDIEPELDELSDAKIGDIFSDESDDDVNEGRFKSTNTTSMAVEQERGDRQASHRHTSHRRRRRSPSPLSSQPSSKREKNDRSRSSYRKPRSPLKTSESLALEKVADQRPISRKALSPIASSKKIEIRIKNPSKYNEAESHLRKSEEGHSQTQRKVNVVNAKERSRLRRDESEEKPIMMVEDVEPNTEIIIEDDNDAISNPEVKVSGGSQIVDNSSSEGGDLRAQLSRKRAQRQNVTKSNPVDESIQTSRLLQTALENAVFKKSKKSKKSKRREHSLKELKVLFEDPSKRCCDNYFCKLTRLQLLREQMKRYARKSFNNHRVCYLYPESSSSSPISSLTKVAQDGKIPIHLRLGLGQGVEILTEPKKKKKHHRSRDQVFGFANFL